MRNLILLLVCSSLFAAKHQSNRGDTSEVLRHPAPGTSIVRFGRVDAGVYRGSKPHTDADFQFLRSKHIHAILDMRFLPLLAAPEARKARQYGMIFLTSPMNGSPVPPSEEHVNRILLILRDKRYRPIYFHCDLGRDRTSLIAALYEMYFLKRSRAAAWRDMKHYGFKESWNLRGLKVYFDEHPKPSPELMKAARTVGRSSVASLHDRRTHE